MVKRSVTYEKAWYALATARILVGFVFLWAFLDKLLGLGFSTKEASAWINGGSPATGFLKAVNGPFAVFFNSLTGPLTDCLFMLALLGVGVALIFGVGLRIAAVSGSLLLIMMWLASFPLKTNPFIDEHLVYAAILFTVAAAPRKWSIANWWLSLPYVKKTPWLW